MSEQEYVDLSDLNRLRHARKILSDIIPENSTIIEEEPFREVMKTLWKLQENLTDEISIK